MPPASSDPDALSRLIDATFRLNNRLIAERDAMVRDLGLTSARWQVLAMAGRAPASPSAAHIARDLGLSRQAVQRIVKDLGGMGLLRANPEASGKRGRGLALTEEGQSRLREANRRLASSRSQLERCFHDYDWKTAPATQDALREEGLVLPPQNSPTFPQDSVKKADRAFEGVQKHILDMIRSGQLVVGGKLPSERELAAEFGLGRSAIREALRSLEMAGVLRFERGAQGGAFVKEASADGITKSIRSMLILGRLPLTDLLDIRATLLGQCARMGTRLGTEADFLALEHNIAELEQTLFAKGPQILSVKPAVEFYSIAAKASHNPLLILLMHSFAELVTEMLETLGSWPQMDPLTPRRDMVRAMREGRADDAERAIQLHSQETNRMLVAYGKNLAM